MKTVEELEALVETLTRERDLSLSAWESAGMTGRTAQSAMLELARQLDESRETIVALTTAMAEKDLEIATLTAALADQTNETTRARLEGKREVEAITDERDELLVRVAEQSAELRATRESYNEARAECERLKTFAAQNFSAMIRQEAEQMRAYGLSYEGVRKVLHEYNDGEISFGKLMDLIRAAARAMAEDMQK